MRALRWFVCQARCSPSGDPPLAKRLQALADLRVRHLGGCNKYCIWSAAVSVRRGCLVTDF